MDGLHPRDPSVKAFPGYFFHFAYYVTKVARTRLFHLSKLEKTFLQHVPFRVEKKVSARAQDFLRPQIDFPPFTHTPSGHYTAHKLAEKMGIRA